MQKNINRHRFSHLCIFIVVMFSLLMCSNKYAPSFGDPLYGSITLSLGMMIVFYAFRLIMDYRIGKMNHKLRLFLTYLFTLIFGTVVLFIAPASNMFFLASLSFYFMFVTLLINSFDNASDNDDV